MSDRQLAQNLWVLSSAGDGTNTGVLLSQGKALLIDCCDTVTPERLAALGVQRVEAVLCTQHRRSAVAGAALWARRGAHIIAAESARGLFVDVAAYWADPKNRWHIYHHQPGPQVLAAAIPLSQSLVGGERLDWNDFQIEVLSTPGATDHALSYLVRTRADGGDGGSPGTVFCFSGDAVCGAGQLWEIASLQKGFGCVGDYHGYCGNAHRLLDSLRVLAACGAEKLIPAHGPIVERPTEAVNLLAQRIATLWRSAASISSLNHYFPTLYQDVQDDPGRMPPAETREPPPFIRGVAHTSFSVVSTTGALLLVDCGHQSVIDTLSQWQLAGEICSVDACWVTHYHDDHVDALDAFQRTFSAPVISEQHMVEVLEHPERFFLPCISPTSAAGVIAKRDGESWRWHEFRLTAFHFPGQTYYHSGLLVEGHGTKVFFAGDSGSPTGIDDHCCPNRCFTGAGRGFRRCLDIWRQTDPAFILNEHQQLAFRFTADALDYMERVLEERECLLGVMLPWAHPDFGADESWVRTFPYDQTVAAGALAPVDIQFTNHGPTPALAVVEPVIPQGWEWVGDGEPYGPAARSAKVLVPERTDGCVGDYAARPDGVVHVLLRVPSNAQEGLNVVPFRVTWDGRYLGQFRHALVRVYRPGGG